VTRELVNPTKQKLLRVCFTSDARERTEIAIDYFTDQLALDGIVTITAAELQAIKGEAAKEYKRGYIRAAVEVIISWGQASLAADIILHLGDDAENESIIAELDMLETDAEILRPAFRLLKLRHQLGTVAS